MNESVVDVAVYALFKYLLFSTICDCVLVFIGSIVDLHLPLWYQEVSICTKKWTRTICKVME